VVSIWGLSWCVRAGAGAAVVLACLAQPSLAADPAPQNDLLNAEVWMQTSVEYRANCLAIYALAKLRLDEALADKNWTAYEPSSDYQNLPPAVIFDLDETAIDNSSYEAGLALNGTDFDPKTWDAWVRAEQARAIPGAVDFASYAASKGVKVFYVTNRNADQKEATRRNLLALGFPMGGNVDTLLMQKDRPEWSASAKGARFAYVAGTYRVLLLFGDNLGDFIDHYNTGVDEREKTFGELKAHFGRDWMVLPNPVYGSWESAPYGNDFTLPTIISACGNVRRLFRGRRNPKAAPVARFWLEFPAHCP
jgi:5'-nucleotidase (lipoprotein e(P4) family)